MRIVKHGLYLDRMARPVGIVQDRGAGQPWRWLTTRGYYVTDTGAATPNGGTVNEDLVKDVTPSDASVAGMDSTMAGLS